jgi:hypothetical protein
MSVVRQEEGGPERIVFTRVGQRQRSKEKLSSTFNCGDKSRSSGLWLAADRPSGGVWSVSNALLPREIGSKEVENVKSSRLHLSLSLMTLSTSRLLCDGSSTLMQSHSTCRGSTEICAMVDTGWCISCATRSASARRVG